MNQVQVSLAERSYPIYIGTNSLAQLEQTLEPLLPRWTHAVLICDARIAPTIGCALAKQLLSQERRTTLLEIPSGEENKSVSVLSRIWSEMIAAKTDRKSVVIAVGGGVVGDLAGFAAASYTRGLRFVQVPTTLLAMVDSSVGGKTGVNLPEAKNMVGAFWQPHAVWIDTKTLDTLPEREYCSGLAEVVKYGVILDNEFFSYLEQNVEAILAREPDQVETMVRRSCELKAQVVAQDERETLGLRAILNYGHTFGHAIEATTHYGRFLHGEAIAIGMTMAGQLALKLGLWNEEAFHRQTQLLQHLHLPILLEEAVAQDLLDAMQLDKKTEHGKLNFILPTKIGHVQTVAGCNPQDILWAINQAATE